MDMISFQPILAISFISLIVVIVLAGFALWAINAYIPMDATIKKILNVVVVVVLILWLLYVFGILPANDITVPKIR